MSENDNDKLKPAEENPWYVLATICDKWDEDDDEELIVNGKVLTNCEVWNVRICHLINEPFRASLIGQDPYIPLFDSPKWDDIKEVVVERFEKRTNGSKLPSLTNIVDFSNTCFSKKVDFKNFVFFSTANFNGSTFENEVDFEGAFFLAMLIFIKRLSFRKEPILEM
jgi:hypothetical protein